MTFDRIEGKRVFLDANIFVYHFTGLSIECTELLHRCEDGSINGFTTIGVIMEVLHRLMMIEAVNKGLVSPGNVAKKLKEKPEVVQQLNSYAEYALRIPEMGIQVLPYTLADCRNSQQFRQKYGLLTNDSFLLSAMDRMNCPHLASADEDFQRVEEIQLFRPADIGHRG
ncbi:type II toxin-antitoxin system VapC family toxin [Desulfofundulus thermobenzoicus]|uniref:type II toxin-antitoxin system VapC family toxin n=1 Tax=Desulfofundulus thermobenzoicus TaxID=29376 RepID=UPI00128ECEC6|nr:PIN domain-containing protein [Desulfofundulus thermobenzoicus]